jgi:hypothetical protein
LACCIFLFLLNIKEKKDIAAKRGVLAEQVLLTPSQKLLMFDVPDAMVAVEGSGRSISQDFRYRPLRAVSRATRGVSRRQKGCLTGEACMGCTSDMVRIGLIAPDCYV